MSDDKSETKSDDKSETKGETKTDDKSAAAPDHTSRVGRFIQTYHGFLSTFVIGAAGLIATSIWQYKQSEIARHQADSQQKVAATQAENSWRIERAEILAKNLQVLASSGGNNVEQRYGVLLSLSRGNILDPELAVSYALELGKDAPDYMRSVLINTTGKDYWRLAHSYLLTCDQRFGVTRAVDYCKIDKNAGRSVALAGLISDEIQSALVAGATPLPMALLKEERQVQQQALMLSSLFTPALNDLYQRRQWREILRFEGFSLGAKLVSALVMAAARTGEFVTNQEATQLEKFHADRRKWLIEYLFGASCDGECKGKLVDVMLTYYAEAHGDYDAALRQLLERPRGESGGALTRLHARLLWCQVDDDDLQELRDGVFVPTLKEMLSRPKLEESAAEDLVGLMALVPPPPAGDAAASTAWRALIQSLEKATGGKLGKIFAERHTTALKERASPPVAMRKMSFCNAAKVVESAPVE